MSITTTYTKAHKLATYTGAFDASSDVLKIALYDNTANLDADTTVYTTTGEVSGAGYTAGGITLTVASGYPQVVDGQAALTFDDAEWPASTITARGAMIYNTTRSNRAEMILDFGRDLSSSSAAFALSFSLMQRPLMMG